MKKGAESLSWPGAFCISGDLHCFLYHNFLKLSEFFETMLDGTERKR